MKVRYTREYNYNISNEIAQKIKSAEGMYEALVILKNYLNACGVVLSLESMSNICKTLRGVEILPYFAPHF